MVKNGFSILELMTTIGIIAIIGAVGFPAVDNFGDQDNYETDLAKLRGQLSYVRQLSLEDGNAYTIRIINNDNDKTADLEIWQAQGLNRYNVEYHKEDTSPKCSDFDGTNEKGAKLDNLTKKLENMVVKRCTSTTAPCSTETETNNFICFLPDGSSPEGVKAEIQASQNAGGKTDYLHIYSTGFFNNGDRM